MGITCVVWAAADREVLPFFLNAEGFLAFLRQVPPTQKIDIDKSWHGIHFLLSRCAENQSPYAAFLLSGGHRFPVPIEAPAPTRAFLSTEVKEIARLLSAISGEILLGCYQPKSMNQERVYPEGWSDLEEGWEHSYLFENFFGLREFVVQAASQNLALIIDYR